MVFLWIYAIDVNLSRPPRASMGGCEQLLPASSDKPAKKLKASAGASDGRNMKSYEIPRYGYVKFLKSAYMGSFWWLTYPIPLKNVKFNWDDDIPNISMACSCFFYRTSAILGSRTFQNATKIADFFLLPLLWVDFYHPVGHGEMALDLGKATWNRHQPTAIHCYTYRNQVALNFNSPRVAKSRALKYGASGFSCFKRQHFVAAFRMF